MSALPDFIHERPGTPDLDQVTLAAAMATAQRDSLSVLEVLEQTSGLESGQLAAGLAAAFDYHYWPANELFACEPAFDRLGSADALRRGCVLVRQRGNLVAVIANPLDATLRPWLESRIPEAFGWAVAARGDVQGFIARNEQSMRAIDTALEGAQGAADERGEVEALSLASISQDASPVVKLVHSTLFDALRGGASDIHLETTPSGLVIRYRIDGVLSQVGAVSGLEIPEQVISRIKVMSELDIAERRVPQDGRIQTNVGGKVIDLRVSVIPCSHGESIVMRILDKSGLRLGLAELGFMADDQANFERMIALPDGILLVTGPTGSGKTTTLYSCLHYINRPDRKIITVEDPVEYMLAGINQVQVHEHIGFTFASALRSMLRQSPNVIMLGEIRDMETATIAINASLTGHLVFSTLHTNDAPSAVARLIDIGVKPFLVASSARCLMAQRLVRKVCKKCAAPHTLTEQEIAGLGFTPEQAAAATARKGKGCPECNKTGCKGRFGLFEIFNINDEARKLIYDKVPSNVLRNRAREMGMRTLREDGMRKVLAGVTTVDEVVRATVSEH